MKPLSPAGERLLVALCRYVYQHGNVALDARWAARLIVGLCGEDVRDPFHQNEVAVANLFTARRELEALRRKD